MAKLFSSLWPSIFCITTLLLLAIAVPLISPFSYYETHLSDKNLYPSFIHPFGTDELGRDIFIRCWVGLQISFFIAFCAAVIDLIIGFTIGICSGYFGGIFDEIACRAMDIISSLPQQLLIILIMILFGNGLLTIIGAIALRGWITMARIARSQTLVLKEFEYVKASQMMGASFFWIARKHFVPSLIGFIFISFSFSIPNAIFSESFMSFLGIGIQPPLPSLGGMISDGIGAIRYYPWRFFFPSALIVISIYSLNLLTDQLKLRYERG